jgi:signal transduction histidine kinase
MRRFYIGKEALLNAVRHSVARKIEIRISYQRHRFRLRCQDDGRGIEPSILDKGGRAGHWGAGGNA